MRHRASDWAKLCRGLENAKTSLADDQLKGAALEDCLDAAVLACWRFGEYAINTCLELSDGQPVTDHSHHERARELKAAKVLQGSYYDVLEKLSRFRKKADYLSYNVFERSTHYNRPDLLNCLSNLEELRQEVESLLQVRGKL